MADTDVFRMQVLPAGHGDCLWIDYGHPDHPTRILVDAGPPGTYATLKKALDAVRGPQPSHDLFLVTHIDADHIGGSLAMLADPDVAAQFKEVWFNGRRHLRQGLEHYGVAQGEKLTAALLSQQIAWNAAFNDQALFSPADSPLMTHQLGGAVLTVLTPTAKELSVLHKHWDQEVRKAGLALDVKAAKPPKKVKPGWEAYGGLPNVAALADRPTDEDTAPANGSSVALLIEFKGEKLLLGADAHPSVLLAGIRRVQPEGRLRVSVFKVPHHGSAANVTHALLEAIDTKVVVFSSNGAYFEHPDQEAVARVIRRYKDQGVHLVFNYKTKFNSMWNAQALQQQWNYTVSYGTAEHGSFIGLL